MHADIINFPEYYIEPYMPYTYTAIRRYEEICKAFTYTIIEYDEEGTIIKFSAHRYEPKIDYRMLLVDVAGIRSTYYRNGKYMEITKHNEFTMPDFSSLSIE